jgi:hypothetical protein
MKTRTLAAFVIGLAAAGFASAQEVSLRATVPFSFVVGNKTMPAGEYRVREESALGTMLIQGAGQATLNVTTPVQGPRHGDNQARLVFRVYGDRYFLSQAWDGGEKGAEFYMTRSERELTAHKHAANQAGVAAIREVVLHK